MTKHRAPTDMLAHDLDTPDPGDAGVVQASGYGSVLHLTGSAGAETRTFQKPHYIGELHHIRRLDAGLGAITIDAKADVDDGGTNDKWAVAGQDEVITIIAAKKTDGTLRWVTVAKTAGVTYTT